MRERILAKGEGWAVVDKPAGILVHPTRPGGPITLRDEVAGYFAPELASGGQVSIVNRLDRETSGAVLVALNAATARHLTIAMQRREIAKQYLTLVVGWPLWTKTRVNLPTGRRVTIEQSGPVWVEQIVHPSGMPSLTKLEVEQKLIWRGQPISLIRAWPETGRMHQIRVHSAHLGHPVIGDKLYMVDTSCYLDFIDQGWTPQLAERLWLPRHALHSACISFQDSSGECHTVESPLPDDLQEVLAQSKRGW